MSAVTFQFNSNFQNVKTQSGLFRKVVKLHLLDVVRIRTVNQHIRQEFLTL